MTNERPLRWLCVAAVIGCGRIHFAPHDGSAGGGGGDGATGDVGDALVTGSSVCPSTVLLADDFEDGVTAPEWTVLTATDLTVAETAGVLRVTYASNSAPTELAGYRETAKADYTGACVIAEITAFPAASSTSLWARIGIAPTDYVGFRIEGGTLLSSLHNGASVMTADQRTFDPVAHRFLRLRENAGTTYWEASPDGATFTLLGSVAAVFAFESATQLDLVADTLSAAQNAGKAEWASVQVLVPP